jgi:hypothetical protein
MSRTRRSFTPEFKAEAARRVIDGGRPSARSHVNSTCMRVCWANGFAPNGCAMVSPTRCAAPHPIETCRLVSARN